jgi:methyl-accepting chemotaxis protein
MHIKQFTLTQKLLCAFGVVSFITIATSITVWINMREIDRQIERTVQKLIPQTERVDTLVVTIFRASLETRHAMLMRTEAKREATLTEIGRLKGEAERLVKEIDADVTSEEGKRRLSELNKAQIEFWRVAVNAIPAIRAGDTNSAVDQLEEKIIPARNQFLAAINQQKDWQTTLLNQVAADALARSGFTEWLLLIVAALTASTGILIAIFLSRHIMRELGGEPQDAVRAMRAVANGDLSTQVVVKSGDDESIMAALAHMQRQLTNLVSQVRMGVDNVATASSQIASGNADLSSRTEQQAAGIEQTSAAMQQMTMAVRANADGAKQANMMVSDASQAAADGGAVVGQVVSTMAEIQDRSKQIGDIVGTIDGIAFQTNILALNAAVEAARAGEAGRGFAVVATEVRALAERSASAAREVKALISASVESVDNGNKLVQDAGERMQEIVAQVGKVRDVIAEIAATSAQQTTDIDQVGSAIKQIDQNTQQNAALVEQSAAAAESLKQQAVHLTGAIGAFRTTDRGLSLSAA